MHRLGETGCSHADARSETPLIREIGMINSIARARRWSYETYLPREGSSAAGDFRWPWWVDDVRRQPVLGKEKLPNKMKSRVQRECDYGWNDNLLMRQEVEMESIGMGEVGCEVAQ